MEYHNSHIIELKRSSLQDNGTFTCYASTFGPPVDEVGDIIEPGAFTPALQHHKVNGTQPAMLWQHDQAEPIGKWLELKQDSTGLHAKGKLTLGTKRGAEAFALLKDNAIAFSIGFMIARDGAEVKNGIRYITKISRLIEISVVAVPANSRAQLTSALQKRAFERLLRDSGGLSRREAKSIVTGNWGNLVRDEQRIDRILNAIDTISSEINRTR